MFLIVDQILVSFHPIEMEILIFQLSRQLSYHYSSTPIFCLEAKTSSPSHIKYSQQFIPRCYRHLRWYSFFIFPPNLSLSLSKSQINQIECREQLNSVILGQSVELLVKAPSLSVYLFTWSNFQFLPANLILKQLSK